MAEKSGCAKCISMIWQFPIFTVAWMGVALVSGFMINKESADINDSVNEALNIAGEDGEWDIKTSILWILIGIICIDGGVTFLSIVTSQWVHECCWNKQMEKCGCCTQIVCYMLNWFLFGMTYLLGLLALIFSGAGGMLIIFAVAGRGVCTEFGVGVDDASIVSVINAILASLKMFICDDSGANKMGSCDDFPTTIDSSDVAGFCTNMDDILDTGRTFFGWMACLIVAQWSFAVIQRANLVESAARRDMAKENANKDESAEMAGGDTGPNV